MRSTISFISCRHSKYAASGWYAGPDERVEPGLDQLGDAAAEHGLLAEQVGLGLLGERGLEHACPGGADALGVGEAERERVARGVLLDGDQRGHAAALVELAADEVAGALRRDHDDVHVGGRLDEAVADVQAVREEQRVALDERRRDRLRVHLALQGVRDQHHDQVGFLARLGGGEDAQAVALRLLPALRARLEAHPDVHARVAQRQRVRVTLAAVSEDGDVPLLDEREVGVVVVEDLCHWYGLFLHLGNGGRWRSHALVRR